jgi:hypothetical protein
MISCSGVDGCPATINDGMSPRTTSDLDGGWLQASLFPKALLLLENLLKGDDIFLKDISLATKFGKFLPGYHTLKSISLFKNTSLSPNVLQSRNTCHIVNI